MGWDGKGDFGGKVGRRGREGKRGIEGVWRVGWFGWTIAIEFRTKRGRAQADGSPVVCASTGWGRQGWGEKGAMWGEG